MHKSTDLRQSTNHKHKKTIERHRFLWHILMKLLKPAIKMKSDELLEKRTHHTQRNKDNTDDVRILIGNNTSEKIVEVYL